MLEHSGDRVHDEVGDFLDEIIVRRVHENLRQPNSLGAGLHVEPSAVQEDDLLVLIDAKDEVHELHGHCLLEEGVDVLCHHVRLLREHALEELRGDVDRRTPFCHLRHRAVLLVVVLILVQVAVVADYPF